MNSALLVKRAAVATLKIICKSLDYKEVIKADFFFWGLLSKDGFKEPTGDALVLNCFRGTHYFVPFLFLALKSTS